MFHISSTFINLCFGGKKVKEKKLLRKAKTTDSLTAVLAP